MRVGRKSQTTTALLAAVAILALGVTPFASAFTFGSSYGAYASSVAASDNFGIYNSDTPAGSGDGGLSATASASTGLDPAGGSASSSSSVDAATHTVSANGAADCSNGNDCYDTYYGGYSGVGGDGYGQMYDTYTFTCASCGYIDVLISYTESGSFAALDNGPVCQGTAVPLSLSAVACESTVDPRIQVGNTAYCAGRQSIGCPPNVIDYQQGWNFCQTGADPLYYCPSATSFSLSGTVDFSQVMLDSNVPFSSAYPSPGTSMQLQFSTAADANVDLPGSESVSGATTFSVTSSTPGVTITSSACGCSTTTPATPSTTTVQVGSLSDNIGSPVSVKAIVAGTSPTGTVSWSSSGPGTFTPPTCTLVSVVCSVNYTPTSVSDSPVTITASYGGDSSNAGSTGTGTLTVNKAYTTTVISCLPNSFNAGGSTTCAASVSGGSSPTGTVSFSTSDVTGSFSPSTSCTLSSGSCSVSYSDSAAGFPTVTGAYSGDSGNLASTGTFALSISGGGKAESTTVVVCSPTQATVNHVLTCTITVTDVSGSPTNPTGKIVVALAEQPNTTTDRACSLKSTDSNNQAYCTISYTPKAAGTLGVLAVYSGDTAHEMSGDTLKVSVSSTPPA